MSCAVQDVCTNLPEMRKLTIPQTCLHCFTRLDSCILQITLYFFYRSLSWFTFTDHEVTSMHTSFVLKIRHLLGDIWIPRVLKLVFSHVYVLSLLKDHGIINKNIVTFIIRHVSSTLS